MHNSHYVCTTNNITTIIVITVNTNFNKYPNRLSESTTLKTTTTSSTSIVSMYNLSKSNYIQCAHTATLLRLSCVHISWLMLTTRLLSVSLLPGPTYFIPAYTFLVHFSDKETVFILGMCKV